MFSKIFRSEQENKEEENNSLGFTTEELVERIEALETKVASLETLLADYEELKSTISQLKKTQEKPANSALNSEHTITKVPQRANKLYLDASRWFFQYLLKRRACGEELVCIRNAGF